MKYVGAEEQSTGLLPLQNAHSARLCNAHSSKVHFATALHIFRIVLFTSLAKRVAAFHSTVRCSLVAAVWGVIQCLALLPGGARVLGKKRQLLPRFRIPLLLLLLLLDLVKVHQMITSVLAGN